MGKSRITTAEVCYNSPMPTIGLTGNFGMGKTSVLSLFRKSGAHVFDVDKFVHNILEKPETIRKISLFLGKDILIKKPGGISIDKPRVAQIIFHDPAKRKAVEKIIHPQVLKMMKEAESGILKKKPSALIVFEVPLLFEAGYEIFFDKTVVVYCRRDLAIKRLARKGFSADEASGRLRAQMSVTRKKKLADFVIDNSYDIGRTEKQVKRILGKIRHIPSY
ncbi:MAG: dephospho-CoA kinase [Nitrospiraceae bacterium]|nr:MAG: dephospho-CoA kinase [Nitrospiraceae bacterium]